MTKCSDASHERSESLAGTASRADRFVLIEHPSPWPAKAAEIFDPALGPTIVAAADAAQAKILLVRRPGQKTGTVRSWAVIDAKAHQAQWGTWERPTDLAMLVDVISTENLEHSGGPVILVCTHARHDACCGIHGRPLAQELAEAYRDAVWEASHVGGHRFAGNVVLPLDGTYYGRVGTGEAVHVIARHFDQEVSTDHLRGFSWMPASAQVVAAEVLRRWGPASADDITDASATALGGGSWRVELSASQTLPGAVTAEVEVRPGPDALLSCGEVPAPTQTFAIVTLDADSQ